MEHVKQNKRVLELFRISPCCYMYQYSRGHWHQTWQKYPMFRVILYIRIGLINRKLSDSRSRMRPCMSVTRLCKNGQIAIMLCTWNISFIKLFLDPLNWCACRWKWFNYGIPWWQIYRISESFTTCVQVIRIDSTP